MHDGEDNVSEAQVSDHAAPLRRKRSQSARGTPGKPPGLGDRHERRSLTPSAHRRVAVGGESDDGATARPAGTKAGRARARTGGSKPRTVAPREFESDGQEEDEASPPPQDSTVGGRAPRVTARVTSRTRLSTGGRGGVTSSRQQPKLAPKATRRAVPEPEELQREEDGFADSEEPPDDYEYEEDEGVAWTPAEEALTRKQVTKRARARKQKAKSNSSRRRNRMLDDDPELEEVEDRDETRAPRAGRGRRRVRFAEDEPEPAGRSRRREVSMDAELEGADDCNDIVEKEVQPPPPLWVGRGVFEHSMVPLASLVDRCMPLRLG